MIGRGQIRWFRFASPDKRRPVLVLGRDDLLPSLSLERSALGPLLAIFLAGRWGEVRIALLDVLGLQDVAP